MTLVRLITVAGIGLLSAGCYTLQPAAAATPAPGTQLSFAINDVGRVALGGSMGPELRRVTGNLHAKEGDDYFVNVAGVDLLQGGYQAWAGETVRINSSYVSAVYERKFSKGRTVAATAVAVGAISLFIAKGGIRSFITDEEMPDTNQASQRRVRIPARALLGLPPFLRSINPPRSH